MVLPGSHHPGEHASVLALRPRSVCVRLVGSGEVERVVHEEVVLGFVPCGPTAQSYDLINKNYSLECKM